MIKKFFRPTEFNY